MKKKLTNRWVTGILTSTQVGVFALMLAVPYAAAQQSTFKNSTSNGYIRSTVAGFYSSPNASAPPENLISKYSPLRVLTRTDKFAKVRESSGKSGWVSVDDLSTDKFYVLSKNPVTTIFKQANAQSGTAFEVTKNVALQVERYQNGWLQIRHFSGAVGWAPTASVVTP